jgi:tetratricopeptide (TPR) repeat protein
LDCKNAHIRDSLISKYLYEGAEKLGNLYNDPKWQLYCDSVIALCPCIAESYQMKAVPFLKNGEYEEAFKLNNKAVELDPKHFLAYRGFLKCIFTKDYIGALKDFNEIENLNPDGYEMDHTYPFYKGLCNLELKNFYEAEVNFKKDIALQQKNIKELAVHFNSLLYIGILYYEIGDSIKAQEYLTKCLSIYKQLPEANYYLALVFKRQGKISEGQKLLQAAKEFMREGYRLNEGNIFYVNYPYQITIFEIEKALNMQTTH